MSYGELNELQADINRRMSDSPAFVFFLKEKIERFLRNNNTRLEVLYKTKEELQDAYVKRDEKGELMTEERDGQIKWVFEDEATKQTYLDRWKSFMDITFEVNM